MTRAVRMSEAIGAFTQRRVWQVGALCRAVADLVDAKLNPVTVQGEISGFSRASSGHCYFSLKDATGQLRCAMFRRAASLLDFTAADGGLVEVRGRVGVYEPRGDLQLVVESMSRSGAGEGATSIPNIRPCAGTDGSICAASAWQTNSAPVRCFTAAVPPT